MQYRPFGATGMRLSEIALGGLLARYEGACGHPPPDVKRRIYLEAAERGINLFDMGYGDEVHIPDELKGNDPDRYFSLKVGAPKSEDLEATVDKHLTNIRRDTIDILRVHHNAYMGDDALRDVIASLKQSEKIRTLCLIRHYRDDQEAYAEQGPANEADADLVMYNYVCRWQEPGIEKSAASGKGVLIMKSLGGQWLGWDDKIRPDWAEVRKEDLEQYAPKGEKIRNNLELIHPVSVGPWHELAAPGETRPRTSAAVQWVLRNQGVSSILVAVASVAELDEVVGEEG